MAKGIKLKNLGNLAIEDPIEIDKNYRKYTSNAKATNKIKKAMAEYYTLDLINKPGSRISINSVQNAIIKTIPIKYIEKRLGNRVERSFFTLDYDVEVPIWVPFQINKYTSIASIVDPKVSLVSLNREIEQRLNDLPVQMLNIEPMKLPPKFIGLFPNGVFNFNTFEFSKNINEFGEYDFVTMNFMRLLTPDKLNPIKKTIAERVLSDWSGDDESVAIYISQMIVAAIEGDGRKTYHIIYASGGNGKSTFLYVLENSAGMKYTVKLNLQDITNDNKVNGIGLTTKFIVGHDLATNYKMSNMMLSRLKELVTGEGFLADVKYKDPIIVQTNALMVQSTNTKPEVFENSNAMRRRLRILPWPDIDFTNNVNAEELDALVGTIGSGDREFYEAMLAVSLNNIKPFKKFIKLKLVEDTTEELISESDQVYNFMEYLEEQNLQYNIIPTCILYVMFLEWHKKENAGATAMKRKTFTTKLINVLPKFGYKYEKEKTVKRIKAHGDLAYPHDFNKTFFNLTSINESEISRYIEKITPYDYSSIIKEFQEKLDSGDIVDIADLSNNEIIMLHYLQNKGNVNAITLLSL